MPEKEPSEPQAMSRRNFMRKVLPLIGAGAVLVPLGVYSLKDIFSDPVPDFDRKGKEQSRTESAHATLTQEQEDVYAALKASVDRQQLTQLAHALENEWVQDPAKASPVIAKALAYTLSTDLPKKEEMLQTILKKVPYARDIRFAVSEGKGDSAIALPELAREGYLGVPVGGEDLAIKPDIELAVRLEKYIRTLPPASRGNETAR
jgi:hypothetical protein